MADNQQIETKPQVTSSSGGDNPFSVAPAEPVASKTDESGPFQLGTGVNTNSKDAGPSDDFVKNKLKELEGKKAISSEDFKQNTDDENRERFARFNGAKAISSADFFGEEQKDDTDNSQGKASIGSFNRDSIGDKMSEAAIYAADRVSEQAKRLKEKATNFWSSLRTSDPAKP